MGPTSANLPAIFVPAGPMLRGNRRGQFLGSGSDVWKYWAERRAGSLDECSWREMEDGCAVVRHVHDDGHGLHDGSSREALGLAPSRTRSPPQGLRLRFLEGTATVEEPEIH